MALTANKKRNVKNLEAARIRNLNVPASVEFFRGTIISINPANGLAEKAPVTGASLYAGIAKNQVDSLTAISTDVPLVVESNHIEQLEMDVAPDPQDVGKPVYYTADDLVTLTIVAGTGVAGSQVGILTAIISGVQVYIDTDAAITA